MKCKCEQVELERPDVPSDWRYWFVSDAYQDIDANELVQRTHALEECTVERTPYGIKQPGPADKASD